MAVPPPLVAVRREPRTDAKERFALARAGARVLIPTVYERPPEAAGAGS